MIGSTILHYKILEKLGEGGMGIVYLAEDLNLERKVAIKFLPGHIAGNSEEKERFKIEAKAAAALNHSNIATIYSIEESGENTFLVMEFIDGIELKDKIKSGPIPVKEAINIAIQIAEGLEAAHKKGIVHRDIKSQNIMITNEGKVKVMDFGLAKMKGRAQLTKAGSTLGTLEYMAPEQAKGEEVDQQSDIWSFGVVLYEMLTGKMPFAGDYDAAVVYNILNEEPSLDNIQDSALGLILKKCLEKDKTDRCQSIKEVIRDLKIDKQISGEKQTVKVEAPKKKSRLPVFIISGVAVVILAVAAYFLFFSSEKKRENLPPMQTIRLTSYSGEEYSPVLSPDGKSVAFSWDGPKQDNFDIYVKLVDAGNPVRLTTDSLPDVCPDWSPDGSRIAFYRVISSQQPREIYIVPALGGREQKIATFFPGLAGQPYISWSADGKFIYYDSWSVKDSGFVIYRVSIETAKVEQITHLPKEIWGDVSPRVSHDGNYVAFVRGLPDIADVYIKDLSTNKVRQVTNIKNSIDGFTWSNNDKSILLSANLDGSSSLWKIGLSGGSQQKVLSGINMNDPFVSSAGNRLVYAETIVNSNIWKIDLKNPKKETMLISSSFNNFNPDISPDGEKIIFLSDRTGNQNLWICNKDGTNQTQLTFFNNSRRIGTCKWSPNGQEILITSNIDYILNASGGTPQAIEQKGGWPFWSSNGAGLYGSKYPENKLYFFSRDGKTEKQLTKGTGIMPYLYGKYIYYIKEFAQPDIWRVPVNGGEEMPVLQGIPDLQNRAWVVAKNGIYFVRNNNNSPVLEFYDFTKKKIVHIADVPMIDTPNFLSIAIDPDETYILYSKREPNKSDIILVDNFRTE